MLSYLHSFHAGNHADILKHATLTLILEHLNKKNKPYTVIDSHAGRGIYNFFSEEAKKTGECEKGILRLLASSEKNVRNDEHSMEFFLPPELDSYLSIAKKYAKNSQYLGSPLIIYEMMKNESVLFANELNKTEFEKLKNSFGAFCPTCNKRADFKLFNQDAFVFLNAVTPPQIKRGLVLCDPSYEDLGDYQKVSKSLCSLHKKWPVAIIALWYPLLTYRIDAINKMKDDIFDFAKKMNKNTDILDVQFCVSSPSSHIETDLKNAIGSENPRLYGSGMFIINSPYQLDEKMKHIVDYLKSVLCGELF